MRKLILTALLLGTLVSANTLVFDAVNSGWYRDNGKHAPELDPNHFAGFFFQDIQNGPPVGQVERFYEYRSFFTFDLTSLNNTVTSASFFVENSAGGVDEPFFFKVYDVTTPYASINQLSPDLSPLGLQIFNDLGTGTFIGEVSLTGAGLFRVDLNADGIALLNANAGNSSFSIGGRVDETGRTGNRWAFFDVGAIRRIEVQTAMNPIPEPSTLLMMGSGLLLAGSLRRYLKR
jgi:hypothetical protein